jgi:hypothetical protein
LEEEVMQQKIKGEIEALEKAQEGDKDQKIETKKTKVAGTIGRVIVSIFGLCILLLVIFMFAKKCIG